jgi:diaminohydroxyphosphoribosylaminopyrimidine deaminase/5-amino-6-(5-phosphoribosylamino)uracil reductase
MLPSDGNGRVDVQTLLIELGKKGISHLLVEGGGELIGSFMSQGLWDRFICFVSPLIIGGEKSKNSVVWGDLINTKNKGLGINIRIKKIRKIRPDWMFEIVPTNSTPEVERICLLE